LGHGVPGPARWMWPRGDLGYLALTVLRTAFLITVTREWLPSAVRQAVPLNAVSQYRADLIGGFLTKTGLDLTLS
jgi:hypothetical protein